MNSQHKILYVSNPFYLDYDLPLIRYLRRETDLYYFLDLSPLSSCATILKIENYSGTARILDGKTYNITEKFDDLPESKTFIINRKTNKPSVLNFFLQFRLARLIRKINPDIIHFNTDFTHNYFLLNFLLRKTVICTVHDPIPHSDDDTFKEAFKRKFFYRFVRNFIILNSQQHAEFINRYNLYKRNVFISSLGIYDYLLADNSLEVLSRLHSSRTSLQMIMFGRINKYKGINYLLPAFESIVSKYPDVKLIIAGKGDVEFGNNGRPGNVQFLNHYIENEELSELIASSDFVVCPYTDATQSGVIMTAFAFCKPVIATDVGGLRTFVEDGITGLLIEPGNTCRLEEAIEKFILDPPLLNKLSKNIFDKYHAGESSWKSIARATMDIYNKL